MPIYVFALLIGIIAGLRALTAGRRKLGRIARLVAH
jgi:uncharacterized membrane protein